MFEKMIETQTKKQEHKLERWMKKHDSEHPFPDDVVLHENIDYIGDGKACHMMDVYIQNKNEKETGKPLPVLINIHGGGFLLGKKEVNRLFCADMCQRGFAVFCLEYPLVLSRARLNEENSGSFVCEAQQNHGCDEHRRQQNQCNQRPKESDRSLDTTDV